MKTYLLILPVALLVTLSQLMVKWRSAAFGDHGNSNFFQHVFRFMTDPVILSAYAIALVSTFGWLYVVAKLPLTIAFPIYIGLTFSMVMLGGWALLSEPMTSVKFFSVLLIALGIALGVSADA